MKFKTRDKKNQNGFDFGVFGKVPPQAIDLENAVLGQILLFPDFFNDVVDLLSPNCFYSEANKKIFLAMLSLRMKSRPVDTLCVIEELRSKEELDLVGGVFYIHKLSNFVTNATNLIHHCRILVEKFIQREIIKICGENLSLAFEDSTDVFDLLDLVTNQFRDISAEIQERKKISVPTVSIEIIKSLHERVQNAKSGIENENEIFTYFPEWDTINGALFPGLFVIAGRPGMGKGVLMTEMICRIGKKHNIGVINGEMTNKQLMIRIGCNLKNIDNQLWKKDPKEVTEEELKTLYEAMQDAQCLKLHIDDNTYIHHIAAKIRMWAQRIGVKVVLIDFLSLIKLPEENARYFTEVQKLNYILEVLRELAKDLSLPIVLFCQLNRELYKRGGSKEPNLSDLKGTGNIEEFAYQISFLHRPEYYDIFEDDMGESTRGLLYHIIAKHRDGRLGRLKYRFSPQFSKIDNWEFQEVVGWKPIAQIPF